ncbi:HTH-type transcriptional repressor CarH [Actinoallomurus bryophytorum]|uniref:MerR family transcriptional regulator n=1 Tax=Actinoallomurus bryophytorum TaxID=1490222 RepID=A0A543CKZ8_9ACTN|nr:B12-binding domain-containing protein [Actinoallomurus bryophytorum]TQL97774.1 MerR family transcriptional regulator [Actinoallomurus bryophytorum]
MEPVRALLRIGELSRRLGVSAHVLRAWERRYGVLDPARSEGGYRLYSEVDEHRIRVMQAHLRRGLSTAEAAQAALSEAPAAVEPSPVPPGLPAAVKALARALEGFDEASAETLLDRLLTDFTPETVLRDVLLPFLREMGERWRRGEVTVAQEHFASNVLRARLAALTRGWGRGHGPRALLACAPGEQHDIPLMMFGLVLHRNGWRVSYLGASTPMSDLIDTATAAPPRLIVVSATDPAVLDGLEPDLLRLAGVAPLAIGGRGATETVARAATARLLDGDPITEAERLSA